MAVFLAYPTAPVGTKIYERVPGQEWAEAAGVSFLILVVFVVAEPVILLVSLAVEWLRGRASRRACPAEDLVDR